MAARLADEKRREAMRRLELARHAFGNACTIPASSYHFWLPLPESWRAGEFAAEALRRGVAVSAGSAFSVSRDAAAQRRARLHQPARNGNGEVERRELKILGPGLLAEEPDPLLSVVRTA